MKKDIMEPWTIKDALWLAEGTLNPIYYWDNEKQKQYDMVERQKALEAMNPHLRDALYAAGALARAVGSWTDWLDYGFHLVTEENQKAVLDYLVEQALKHKKDLALIWTLTACRTAVRNKIEINPEWVSRLTLEALTCAREDWKLKGSWVEGAREWLAEYFGKAK